MKWLLTNYVFDASAKTVQSLTFGNGDWKIEGILLITNVVDGIIIYNFADPAKGGTITPNAGGDILTLEYDTTSMSDTDELQIYYDDAEYPASDQSLQDAITQLTNIDGKLNHGQASKANSVPVTLASDQDALTVTANAGTDLNTSALALESGGNLDAIKTAVQLIDNFISGARGLVTEDNSAAIKTAVETIDNFISGSRGLVTEDNSAAIKTAVEVIDNFISGSRGLVTEDNSGAIKTSVELIDDAIKTDDGGFTPATDKVMMIGAQLDDSSPDSVDEGDAGAVRMSANRNLYVRIRDNAGNERGLNVDANGEVGISAIRSALPAGTNAIGKLAANSGVDIGDVDVTSVPADPFGANADAAVAAGAAGSIQAKLRRATQGLEDLKTLIVLAAGNNNIGDVDVASIAAGTNLIGKTVAQLSTSAISNGTTDVTPKFAKIDRATNADGAAVVNLVSAKKIRVLTLTMVSAGTVSVKWQSSTSNSTGAGSNTDLTGLMSLVANTGMADVFSPVGLFETVAGEALKLNLNAAVQVSGYLTYLEI